MQMTALAHLFTDLVDNVSGIGAGDVVMVRGMLRVVVLAVATLALVIVIYLLTVPTFDHLHIFVFSDHDSDVVDYSYGVIIDAGSTGSRLFLYRWKVVSDRRLIDMHPALDEFSRAVVKKANPGLSTFANNPENATDYIRPLLDYAVKYVPVSKQPYTPIFIFATAGMRLIPIRQQEAIMKNLHTNLPLVTPLQVIAEHIRVIEGKWEGIFSWIAVNYILGRFNRNESEAARPPTVGMIDMGGASLQIAIELSSKDRGGGHAIETVNLGCRDDSDIFRYRLFVTTFLGYGVNEGLRKYEQLLGDTLLAENKTSRQAYIRDSCLPTNLVKTVSRKDGSQFVRKGVGDWDECVAQLSDLVARSGVNDECEVSNCYLGQVVAPKISLSDMELYGFSECWFSTEDVLSLGGQYNYTLLSTKARDFCRLRWSTIQSRSRLRLYPKANEDRLRSQCFKSAWIAAVLHKGFSLDKFRNRFRSAFDISGEEVQWTLGAMLYNMRYFPLRDVQRRYLLEKRRRENAHSRGSLCVLFIFAVCIIVAVVLQRWWHVKKGFLKREPSMWGYMMLSQDQLYPSHYNIPSFS
uniref:Nucleoside-diphosphatase mig-23 n=3 Tax=Parascaris univalens TaxID=6257 RepID=A0A915AUY6_PARUN